jgi:hypothetical protein
MAEIVSRLFFSLKEGAYGWRGRKARRERIHGSRSPPFFTGDREAREVSEEAKGFTIPGGGESVGESQSQDQQVMNPS